MKKRLILITILSLFAINKSMASEYYGLILGVDSSENIIMKGVCYEFPLNKYVDVINEDSKKLEKYIPIEKIEYLKISITYNDDFFKKSTIKGNLIERDCLKDPELLKKYLTNIWFYISTNKQKMIADKIFENEDEIDEFMAPVFTLIGIMSVATEMKCKHVTWITMKY